MASSAYYSWIADGKPFELATPVRQYRDALRAAGWAAASVGTIGDGAHLRAEPPQDHTPFSATGWPNHSPYPFVHAIDVSTPGPAGMSTPALAAAWIEVHISIRTDHTYTSIGAYPVVREGNPVTSTQTGRDVWAETIGSPSLGYNQSAAEWLKFTYANNIALNAIAATLTDIVSKLDDISTAPTNPIDPVALGHALAQSPGFIETLAAAVADKLGDPITAEEIRDAVAGIEWVGKRV